MRKLNPNWTREEKLKVLKKILSYSTRKGDCLICYLGIDSRSRPRIELNRQHYPVARLMMHLIKGFDMTSDDLVLHKDSICTSQACIEIDHLKVGDHYENAIDRIKKHGMGRFRPRGKSNVQY